MPKALLTPNQQAIMKILGAGEATTSFIVTALNSGNHYVHNQLRVLATKGFVRGDTKPNPNPPKQGAVSIYWSLTERGKQYVPNAK